VAWRVTHRYAYQPYHNRSARQGDMPHVFLPFAMGTKGLPLYEKMVERKVVLGDETRRETISCIRLR
jgi:hypothetical protein